MADRDDIDVPDPKQQKANLVLRTHGAMTGLPPHPRTGDTWVVLTPHPKDVNDWKLKANPGASQNTPSLKYVFPTEQEARAVAASVDRVEGGWGPGKDELVEVEKVVVHFTDRRPPVEFDGADYDAVFWSESARQKFLESYYAATILMSGMYAPTQAAKLAMPIGHQRWSKTGTS